LPGTIIHAEPPENDVKLTKPTSPAPPAHDYSPALQCAVSWLGNRYLLAAPVMRRPVQRRHEPRDPFFVETRRWFPLSRR
jgi:hypothetical protein